MLLKQGNAIAVDLTADGQVVYLSVNGNQASLEAVPAAGGQQAVIAQAIDPQTEPVSVVGAVVGIWKGLDANNVGTFSFWTKATGLKADVATGSVATLFAGSDDGTKVAFSVNGTATTSDLAVTNTAAPSATAVLAGSTATGTGINLAAQNCSPDVGFVGKRLFSAHCSGTAAGAVAARLYTVADGATTPVRLDANGGAAGTIKAFWLTDKTGTKAFATASNAGSAGLVFSVAAPGSPLATLDADVTDGFLTDDGSAVVYRTSAAGSTGIRRASATATPAPITLVADGELLGANADKSKILVSVVAPVDDSTDIRVADVTTANQTPTVIVPTATARPIGFTRGGTHVVYLTDVSDTGNTLKAKPVAGGNEVTIAQDISGLAFGPGGYVIVIDTEKQVSQDVSTFDLKTVDLTKGTTLTKVSDSVLSNFFVSANKLVYSKLAQQGSGIYAADLP